MIIIKKNIPDEVISVIYFDSSIQKYYTKRFLVENTDKKQQFLSGCSFRKKGKWRSFFRCFYWRVLHCSGEYRIYRQTTSEL